MGNYKSEHYYGDVRLLGKRNQNYPAQSGTNCPIPFNLIWESSSDLLRKITPPLWLQIATKPFSPDTIQWFRKACQSGTLAREFCECEQWFDYAGRANLTSENPVLVKIAKRLGVALPKAKGKALDVHPRPSTDYPDHAVSGTL